MTPERMQRAYELFEQALERPPEERAAFLAKACAADVELRAEVESLLEHDSRVSDDFMRPPEPEPTMRGLASTRDQDSLIGSRVGSFLVRRVLGWGGMGKVYAAEQERPHRTVALKIIKLGMDTAEVLARFEIEREALAMMNHSGIAKVFEAGATEQGRPYFAMEYVAGVPITEHCSHHAFDIGQRLRLFNQVCDAVQHAHQKGVIHRDLKPSNILVEDVDGT
ncbi:MAG: serine/threonine protein kinase, partial [Planctomycetota bacterium]